MGKNLQYSLVVIFAIGCITGSILGCVKLVSSIDNKAKADFERRDATLFINGTILEIQYDFNNDLWLTLESGVYNLGDIYRKSDYRGSKESLNINELLEDIYYVIEVNNSIIIYATGKTVIGNLIFFQRSYDNLYSYWFAITGLIIGIMLPVVIIIILITYISCYEIYHSHGKTHYKKKYEKRGDTIKHLEEVITTLRKEVKELKEQQKSVDMKSGSINSMEIYCHECGSKIEEKHWDNIACGNCEHSYVNKYDIGCCKLGYDTWSGNCGHKKEKKIHCSYCGAEVRT